MSPPRPLLVFSLCALCLQGWAQSPSPAPKAAPAPAAGQDKPAAPINSKEEVDAEFIILAGLPITKAKEDVLRYCRQTYVKSDLIGCGAAPMGPPRVVPHRGSTR